MKLPEESTRRILFSVLQMKGRGIVLLRHSDLDFMRPTSVGLFSWMVSEHVLIPELSADRRGSAGNVVVVRQRYSASARGVGDS